MGVEFKHTLARAAWTALLWAGLGASAAAAPAASELLEKSRAVYAGLKSYSDTGTVEAEFGQTGGQVRERHAFSTAYRTPRQYFFDFRKAGGSDRYVAWGDGETFHSWWQATGQQQDFPRGQGANAFVFGASPTKNAIVQLAPLLFPGAGLSGPLTEFAEPVYAGMETIGGHNCHKLTGVARSVYRATSNVVDARPATVWIDAETLLVRRILEDRSHGKLLDRSTTTFEPKANPPLDERAFRFTPPAR